MRAGLLVLCVASILSDARTSGAEQPGLPLFDRSTWPQSVSVSVGDVRSRIDGPKMWTLSGITYQGTELATEDSAYGTVLTIRGVGPFGTAHFLDVPGKPGEVEKENVTSLELFLDEKAVLPLRPRMELSGRSFRMERRSKLRTVDLESTVRLRDGVLSETAKLRANGPMDLKVAYPFMYALAHRTTHYVFGDESGVKRRGVFRKEGKTEWTVIQDATWVAEFDAASGKGAVVRYLRHPPKEDAWFLLVDAPGIYHKVAAYTMVDKVVAAGFEATYQSAVGFFTATEKDWVDIAMRKARELKAAKVD